MSRAFRDTITASVKLQTALGLCCDPGYPKDTTFPHHLFCTYFHNGTFQIKAVSPRSSHIVELAPLDSPDKAISAHDHLAHIFHLSEPTYHYAIAKAFHVEGMTDHGTEFRHSTLTPQAAAVDQKDSWRSMYATQPPTKLLALYPTNRYSSWYIHYQLTEQRQHDLSKYLILVNESGVKIGDIFTAVELATERAEDIRQKVRSDYRSVIARRYWEIFEVVRELQTGGNGQDTAVRGGDEMNGSEQDSVCGGESEEDSDSEEDDDDDEKGSDLIPEDKKGKLDLWNDFHFKLFTPEYCGDGSTAW